MEIALSFNFSKQTHGGLLRRWENAEAPENNCHRVATRLFLLVEGSANTVRLLVAVGATDGRRLARALALRLPSAVADPGHVRPTAGGALSVRVVDRSPEAILAVGVGRFRAGAAVALR